MSWRLQIPSNSSQWLRNVNYVTTGTQTETAVSVEGAWDGAYVPEQTYGPLTTETTQIAEVEGVACPGSCVFDFILAVYLNFNQLIKLM